MTLGINRQQIYDKLVQIAEDLKNERNSSPQSRTELSEGDGFNVEWSCRAELMVLIASQLTDENLEQLLNSVTTPVSIPQSSCCILLQKPPDQHIWINNERLYPHLFLYKMLVNPQVVSVATLKPATGSNCAFSFYKGVERNCSSSCINPRHYEVARTRSSVSLAAYNDTNASVTSESGIQQNLVTSTIDSLHQLDSSSLSSVDDLQPPHLHQHLHFSAIDGAPTAAPALRTTHLPSSMQSNPPPAQHANHNQSPDTAGLSEDLKPPHPTPPSSLLAPVSVTSGFADSYLEHNVSYSQVVKYEPVRHWCSVAYYEGETKLGETYKADENQFQIDGLTDPSSSQRFCLGIINRTSRDQLTRQIRRVIDQGIKLYWDEVSQEMHVECVSQHAVFFQSHCFNSDYNFAPHTVVKIPPGSSACVFRLETFTRAIQYNLRVEEYSYSRVYDMSTMCQVRISFVKGWGETYRRAKITQCPCWVDITLNGPLHMLDKVLRYLHPPLSSLSSGSGGKNSPVQVPTPPNAAGTPTKGGTNMAATAAPPLSVGSVAAVAISNRHHYDLSKLAVAEAFETKLLMTAATPGGRGDIVRDYCPREVLSVKGGGGGGTVGGRVFDGSGDDVGRGGGGDMLRRTSLVATPADADRAIQVSTVAASNETPTSASTSSAGVASTEETTMSVTAANVRMLRRGNQYNGIVVEDDLEIMMLS